jgi:hypothetical protein
MIRVRELRFWTALIAIALCVVALDKGWALAQLGWAEAFADPANAEARLRPLVDEPLTGARAKLDLLSVTSAEPTRRADDLVHLLSVSPLNGGAWLDLAIVRRSLGKSAESVATSLTMSTLTWPNEALTMAGRVQFAAPFWSALPPDTRRALIGDLVASWSVINQNSRSRLMAIWGADGDGQGQEIRAALLTRGAPGPQIAAALFPSDPQPGDAR